MGGMLVCTVLTDPFFLVVRFWSTREYLVLGGAVCTLV